MKVNQLNEGVHSGRKKGTTYLTEARYLLPGVPRTLLMGSAHQIISLEESQIFKENSLPQARNIHNILGYFKNIKAKHKICDFNLYPFKLHGEWKNKECLV